MATGMMVGMTATLAVAAVAADLTATGTHLSALWGRGGEEARGGGERRAMVMSTAAGALHGGVLAAMVWAQGASVLWSIAGAVVGGGVGLLGVYLWLGWRRGLVSLGSLVMPLVALSVLPPMLSVPLHQGGADSVLVVVHVAAAILGTAAFVLALVLSVLYLVQARQLKRKRFHPWLRRLPPLEQLDGLGLRVVVVGFALYSLSIVLGTFRAWQQVALHFDPRILFALGTWAVYALMLQGRVTAGWQGMKAAKLTIAGALCALGVIVFYFVRG